MSIRRKQSAWPSRSTTTKTTNQSWESQNKNLQFTVHNIHTFLAHPTKSPKRKNTTNHLTYLLKCILKTKEQRTILALRVHTIYTLESIRTQRICRNIQRGSIHLRPHEDFLFCLYGLSPTAGEMLSSKNSIDGGYFVQGAKKSKAVY
jgi:hypothetical protein